MSYQTLFPVTLYFYAASCLAFLGFFITQKARAGVAGFILAFSGFLVHCAYFVYRSAVLHYFPVSNLYESLSFFAWLIMALYLASGWRSRQWTDGIFVTPLAVALMAYARTLDASGRPLPPALQSPWLAIHATLCFVSYACFTLSFTFAVMYIWQEKELKSKKIDAFFFRLPAIEFLDRLGYRAIAFGFVFLTFGIISGSLWAQHAWGTFWSWDPKETWALIMWLVYLVYLHGRRSRGWKARKSALVAIAGFCIMIFTYLGVSFLLPGLHSYLH